MLNEYSSTVMKVRSNLVSDTGYNKSIHITIAGKEKHRMQKQQLFLGNKSTFRNKRGIRRFKASLKG